MEFFASIWDLLVQFMDVLLHVDVYLRDMVTAYGYWVYAILFLIVFCETGLVITPFLPGDSLLFAAGALAGAGFLGYAPLAGTLLAAAIIGDAVNFRIGRYIGPAIFSKNYRWLKKEHLEQAHAFYEKHGGRAIILARFVPIVRTFAPFVAGVAYMNQARFLFFNVTGALVWVFGLVTAGYFLGNLEFVQKNFSILIYAIVLVSVLPVVIEWFRHCLAKKKIKQTEENGLK